MERVIIESPFHGDTDAEAELYACYARRALADSLKRGEAPFASHMLYTQVLDDAQPEERSNGIAAGLEWGRVADVTVVYKDYGVSSGMHVGIRSAERHGRRIIERYIGKNP
jgi:hypothetical protein